jgi:hypothetical protein
LWENNRRKLLWIQTVVGLRKAVKRFKIYKTGFLQKLDVDEVSVQQQPSNRKNKNTKPAGCTPGNTET